MTLTKPCCTLLWMIKKHIPFNEGPETCCIAHILIWDITPSVTDDTDSTDNKLDFLFSRKAI